MIYYIGYYIDNEYIHQMKTVVSSISKMNYISSLLENEDSVTLISRSYSIINKIMYSREKKIGDSSYLINFKSYWSFGRITQNLNRLYVNKQLESFCLKNIKSTDVVVIYHSTDDLKLIELLKQKIGCKIVLEVEEIYADVTNDKDLKLRELKAFENCDGFIISVEELYQALKIKKPYIVINGTYKPESLREVSFDDTKIHCIYAGTFDQTKGGALAAVKAAEFLPKEYHVHILGFGTEKQVENIKNEINKVQNKVNCILTYDGLKSGDEYIEFLQKCHIGLCTQIPDAKYVQTSFPSKILVYLANGLRVLSVYIPAIANSKVGNLLYYYNDQNPQVIAQAIRNIDISKPYNSRNELITIDNLAKNEIKELIRNVKK
ncbi:hypothetical protein DW895_01715 [Firmicutes bacterium AM41-11]|nr:hypothetical protein DW895_01715 [Firmicutes bacterium AM41-11]